MKIKVEKERKWLLKRNPEDIEFSDIFNIYQFYTEDGWRYRNIMNEDYTMDKYEKVKKVSIEKGINNEVDFQEVTEEEFHEAQESGKIRELMKTRRVFEYEGRKFEIDEFDEFGLTILEIEDVEMSDVIKFPPEIEKLILMEVTGNSKFSNYNLAEEEDYQETVEDEDFL